MNHPGPLESIPQYDASLRKQFALDVLVGLSASQKYLPSKYFYDARGSDLFRRITASEEYYLTGCELDIFNAHGAEIVAALAGDAVDVVEFGAGDGHKTAVLLSHLERAGKRFSYMPVDISEIVVAELVAAMRKQHPTQEVIGLVGEYCDGLRHLSFSLHPERPKLVLFLGSNIGNFEHREAMRFLHMLRDNLREGDYLLTGFDLRKDVDVLLAAYNDREGLTREFNLNVLRRINDELGGHLQPEKFSHYGFYNPTKGAMESYLIAREEQDVHIANLNRTFHFDAFEGIHMECSCKYRERDIESMADHSGFDVVAHWKDARNWFADSLWRARKPA